LVYNKKNTLGILKQNFKKLMKKSNLHIYFLFNVFTCHLLYNLLRYEDETNNIQLLWFIKLEATLDERIQIHVQVNATKDLGMQTHVEGQ
jgi:hypothetical protein